MEEIALLTPPPDFEPLCVRVGIPISIGSASACAGSYSYCCHKRLSFITVDMQLLQGYGLGR